MLLHLVTRLGAVTMRQAHRYVYDGSYANVRRRVQFMVEAGLLNRLDTVPSAGTILWPTRAGRVAAVGEDSPLVAMQPPSEATMIHRLMVSEEVLRAVCVEGRRVMTEREIRLFQERGGDQLYRLLSTNGVVRSVDGSAGVVPTTITDEKGTRELWLQVAMHSGDTVTRTPDFVEVTERGTLVAVEVELASKPEKLMRTILEGYREACTAHQPAPMGQGLTMKNATPEVRQFESVRWVCSDPVFEELRGPANGIDPLTQQPRTGLVRSVWDSSLSTHLFFHDPSTWLLNRARWPISVARASIAHDAGLEYAVLQRTLPDGFRCSLRAWKQWRQLWDDDTAGDDDRVGFDMWLRAPGNLRRCLNASGR